MTSLGGYVYLYDEFGNELEYGKYFEIAGRKKIMQVWAEKHGKLASYFQVYPKILNSILYRSEYQKQRNASIRQRINQATNG